MIISIDGPAASGKGTLSKKLAKKYNLAILDTGKLYRVIGLMMLEKGLNPENPADAETIINHITPSDIIIKINNPNLTNDDVGQAASKVSALACVRSKLLDLQRDFAHNPPIINDIKPDGAVLDGRDIGTIVCPDADYKIYLDAKVEIRANRRFLEFSTSSKAVSFEKVLSDMQERDKRDKERTSSPLIPAKDAFIIDSSNLSIEEVFNKACDFISN